MFKCSNCNKMFTPSYRVGVKVIKYCSKSCATKAQRGRSKKDLELEGINFIKNSGSYISGSELFKLLKISSKTLVSKGLKVYDLNLKAGYIKPKSIFQFQVGRLLSSIFFLNSMEEEKSFKNCLSPKGYRLRFDFFIPDLNLLVEADGVQHVDKNNKYYSSYNQVCDSIKDKFCIDSSINLVRIPYNRNITKKHILKAFDTPSKKKLLEYS